MFYENGNINTQSAVVLIKHPENRRLVKVLYDIYKKINVDGIDNRSRKHEVEFIKEISKSAVENIIVSRQMMLMMLDSTKKKLPKVFKENVIDGVKNNNFSKEQLQMLIEFYASKKYSDEFVNLSRDFINRVDNYVDANMASVIETKEKLKETERAIIDGMSNFLKDTEKRGILLFDVGNLNPEEDSIVGQDNVVEDSITAGSIKLRSGIPAVDNIFGSLRSGKQYVLASIAGHFKSGTMINIAEGLCLNNPIKRDDPMLEDGMKPAVLHISLEDSELQILEKRAAFHHINSEKYLQDYRDAIRGLVEVPKGKIIEPYAQRIINELKSKYRRDTEETIYPRAVYKSGQKFEYGSRDLTIEINRLREEGYQVICVIFDYLALAKYEKVDGDEEARILPLQRNAYRLRAVTDRLKIPLVTATQLNRGGEEMIMDSMARGLGREDFIRVWNASALAGAHALKQVPDMFAFCFNYDIGGKQYYSILLDKDRADNSAVKSDAGGSVSGNTNGRRMKGPMTRIDKRPHIVSEMDGFYIGDKNFARSIKDLISSDSQSILTAMEGTPSLSSFDDQPDKITKKKKKFVM